MSTASSPKIEFRGEVLLWVPHNEMSAIPGQALSEQWCNAYLVMAQMQDDLFMLAASSIVGTYGLGSTGYCAAFPEFPLLLEISKEYAIIVSERDIKVTIVGPNSPCNVELRFKDTQTLWTFTQAYAAGQAAAERRDLLERNKREQLIRQLEEIFPRPPSAR
ncbi:hypothetical protein TRAPUB_12125, partial [Trametes pubescens]